MILALGPRLHVNVTYSSYIGRFLDHKGFVHWFETFHVEGSFGDLRLLMKEFHLFVRLERISNLPALSSSYTESVSIVLFYLAFV